MALVKDLGMYWGQEVRMAADTASAMETELVWVRMVDAGAVEHQRLATVRAHGRRPRSSCQSAQRLPQ